MTSKSTNYILSTSETYDEWVRLTRAALLAARVWRHTQSAIAAPVPVDAKAITATEAREIRVHEENEEQALGIILERLDPANSRLVAANQTAHDCWTTLATTHNQQTGNRQYQLYQKLAATVQKTGEPLPEYFQHLEQAGDRLSSSLATGATADVVINLLVTFLGLSNMEATEENENFEVTLSIAGALSRTTVASAFLNEQTRRDTAKEAKESGLASRVGRPARRNGAPPKAGSPTCSHCQKAHKSEDCYSKHPEKMPQWMKERNEEQRKRRAQQAKGNETQAHAASHDSSDEEGPERAMMASPPYIPTHSSSHKWIADSGATSSMTPHRHWIRNLKPCHVPVSVASGKKVYATGRGEVWFQPRLNGSETDHVIFTRVLYVPDLSNSLFAVLPVARKRGVVVSFDQDKVKFNSAEGETFMTASYEGKTAILNGKTLDAPAHELALTTASSPKVTMALLHRRMAHIHP